MSEPLRVMHILLSLDVGGLERNVVNQVSVGHELGQEVSILCVEKRGTLATRAESLGGQVFCTEKPPGFRLGTIGSIRKILRGVNPHVIHTHQIGPLFYSGFASLGLGIPLIVHTEHGKENYAGSLKTRVLGRIAGGFAAKFYCLSQDMADAVSAAGIVKSKKIALISNGIDTSAYRLKPGADMIREKFRVPANAPIVGSVGRLTEVKRQDVLIDAFARLLDKYPDAHLLLVGDGPLLQTLRQQAESLNISHRVHFVGYQKETAPFLHAMDLFTLTSRSEGMPQALLEACVAAKPIIATRVGGIPEVIRDGITGLLVNPGETNALADGLISLLENPTRARSMAELACNEVMTRFDIGRMAREYHRDFREALGNLVPATERAVLSGSTDSQDVSPSLR